LAVLTPVMVYVQHRFGWQGLFIITGAVGIAWGLVWYLFYRDPSKHTKVNQAELDHIKRGGGLIDYQSQPVNKSAGQDIPEKPKFSWANLQEVFSHRKLWG